MTSGDWDISSPSAGSARAAQRIHARTEGATPCRPVAMAPKSEIVIRPMSVLVAIGISTAELWEIGHACGYYPPRPSGAFAHNGNFPTPPGRQRRDPSPPKGAKPLWQLPRAAKLAD